MIVFVGNNFSPNILTKWIEQINLNSNDFIYLNINDDALQSTLKKAYAIIALGNIASKVLNKINVPHFTLPHHHKNKLQLIDCRHYIIKQYYKPGTIIHFNDFKWGCFLILDVWDKNMIGSINFNGTGYRSQVFRCDKLHNRYSILEG